MASPVDTSVKFYRDDFPGAPVLNGVAGSAISLLDACLVTGFGLRTATSLVVSGGVATLTLSSDAKNANLLYSVVTVDGSSITALNGEQRVTAASSTELKFATAAANGTATGTITVKTAPAGWEKKYNDTNVAVFKSLDVTSLGAHLWVNDAGTTNANVRAYESMTDANTGAGATPTLAEVATGGFWPKSVNANATAVRWDIFADSRAFYYAPVPAYSSSPTYIAQALMFFGDIVSYKSGDAFASGVFASRGSVSDSVQYGHVLSSLQGNTSGVCKWLRSYTGLGSAATAYAAPMTGSAWGISGGDSTLGAFPSPTDGGLRLSEVHALEGAFNGLGTVMRGEMPGAYYVPQSAVGTYFQRGDTTSTVGGKKMYVVYAGSNAYDTGTAGGRGFIDITGPWR